MMINKVLSLTKVFLKNSYQNNFKVSNKKDDNKTINKILKLLGFVLLFGYLMAIFGVISYGIIDSLIKINQPAVFLGLFLLSTAVLIIFQTIFSSVNIFYFARDIEYILPMPVKPSELLIAKFNTILCTEYFTEFLFLLTPIIIYGIMTAQTILFYIYALLILLIFPILPAILACLIIMLIMCFSNLTKNKDKFQLITTILAIVVAVGIQFIFYNNGNQLTDQQMIDKIIQVNGLVDVIGRYFITIGPSIDVLINSSNIIALLHLGKLIAITALGYIIFITLGNKIYLKGAINTTGGAKTKKLNENKAYKKRNIFFSYILKEFKILFRNPIFFTQCVLPIFLMPVIILISVSVSFSRINELDITTLSIQVNSVILAMALSIIQFLQMFSFIAITAVSRDGLNAKFVKYIPISLYKQFKYKIAPAIILNTVSTIILLGIMSFIMPSMLIYLVGIFIVSTIMNIIQSYLMLIIDLKRPKLEWDTEYAVVKQNMNMIFEIGYSFVVIGLTIGLSILLIKFNSMIFLGILFIISILCYIMINRFVYRKQNTLFEKIY